MSSGSNIRILGRAILMGYVVGLGLSGCVVPMAGEKLTAEQVTAQQRAYNQALATRSSKHVTQFVKTYRTSPMSASLLNQMPASVLSGVPQSAVINLSDNAKRQLSPRVRGQFGIAARTSFSAGDNRSGDSGGGRSGGYGG
jgi:hypothetical protein